MTDQVWVNKKLKAKPIICLSQLILFWLPSQTCNMSMSKSFGFSELWVTSSEKQQDWTEWSLNCLLAMRVCGTYTEFNKHFTIFSYEIDK